MVIFSTATKRIKKFCSCQCHVIFSLTPSHIFRKIDVYWNAHRCDNWRIRTNKMRLMVYCSSDRLNMFQALLWPSSEAHDYSADYHTGSPVIGLLLAGSWVQGGWKSVLSATACSADICPACLHLKTTQERDGQCGNQHYSRDLLMMGIIAPEKFWTYHKYNKTISST